MKTFDCFQRQLLELSITALALNVNQGPPSLQRLLELFCTKTEAAADLQGNFTWKHSRLECFSHSFSPLGFQIVSDEELRAMNRCNILIQRRKNLKTREGRFWEGPIMQHKSHYWLYAIPCKYKLGDMLEVQIYKWSKWLTKNASHLEWILFLN